MDPPYGRQADGLVPHAQTTEFRTDLIDKGDLSPLGDMNEYPDGSTLLWRLEWRLASCRRSRRRKSTCC